MIDTMSAFEKSLNELIQEAEFANEPVSASADEDLNAHSHDRSTEKWMNDVQIFKDKYLKDHSLCQNIETNLFHRRYKKVLACLESIRDDKEYISKKNGVKTVSVPSFQARSLPQYDVFISHASKDKPEIIEKLYKSLKMLSVNIFYDKEEIEWGDKWKDKILQGTQISEFAIIVISENFFGREWTERELREFLTRQNRSGQKIILPVLHNISIEQLVEKYPSVADIQAISSKDYTCDQIALMFANQYIKRLKTM